MRRRRFITFMILLPLFAFLSNASGESISQIYQQSYDEEGKGNYMEAIFIMMRAERSEEKSYLFHLRMGWLNYLAKKFTDSASAYQRAVRLNKDSIEARLGLMLPLITLGKWTDAEKLGKEILLLDKASYLANSRLAYIYYNMKLYKEAEAYYRKILQYYPGDIEMQAGLAWSLFKQDKKGDAEKIFSEILRYAPNHVTANVGMKMVKEK
ncbi:MAG: tetratricopeptide repeat protein [Thermodesulfobacteriota bacterium]|nr:tetratricopeptide repeat protein [Thermodesulfobacteriota bacterium]